MPSKDRTELVIPEKPCTRCGLTKPLSEFHRSRRHRDGHNTHCKACRASIVAAYIDRDPKRRREMETARLERGRRRNGVPVRPVFSSPAERRAARKISELNSRAKREGAIGAVTAHEWKQILLFYGNACAQCRVSASERPLTVDHYVPMSKGGENTWRNVWPLCVTCNYKKRDRVPDGEPPHVAVLVRTGTSE